MIPWLSRTTYRLEEAVMQRPTDAGLAEPDHIDLVVFSALFPSVVRPGAGPFIRERMFRIAHHRPLAVVSPQPWFPGQSLIRLLRPGNRPQAPELEIQQDIRVYHPRYLSVPGLLRKFDGVSMALAGVGLMRKLKRQSARLIDAHFACPDGETATRLGRRWGLPVTITLRGTDVPHSRNPVLRPLLSHTLNAADRVFSVSTSLRRLALELGTAAEKTEVVGNGVDLARFHPVDRVAARQKYGLPQDAKVFISVRALVPRNGMHRVIEVMPALLERHPDLHYTIVVGASPEGDDRAELTAQVAQLELAERVHFLGTLPPDELKWALSASDLFVLATGNEGWANVFLEAMACSLPVVTTDVGGNAEVVCREERGSIVPFGDSAALWRVLDAALGKAWDGAAILDYARANPWVKRVAQLLRAYETLINHPTDQPELAVK